MVVVAQNLFYALGAELLSGLLAWRLKGNPRGQVLALLLGTIMAGTIAFGPAIYSESLRWSGRYPSAVPALVSSRTLTASEAEPQQDSGRFVMVPIDSIANTPLNNLARPIDGERTLAGVPFRILSGSRAIFQTEQHLLRSNPTSASIAVEVGAPRLVHILINGAYVYQTLDGQTAGRITLRFEDGTAIDRELVVGLNLRENWAYTTGPTPSSGPSEVVTQLPETDEWTNAYSEQQLRGVRAASGLIDMVTVPIPASMQGTTLVAIDVRDLLLDPSLILYGVTIETTE